MQIEPMKKSDIDRIVWVIAQSMNDDEARWARETLTPHFTGLQAGVADGRQYFVWYQENSIEGIVGLHRYIWGPSENVWLAWFAITPQHQRKGWGSRLLAWIEQRAREQDYKKMFIETYDHPIFDKARSFYAARGYTPRGRIDEYLPDGSPMIVLGKKL